MIMNKHFTDPVAERATFEAVGATELSKQERKNSSGIWVKIFAGIFLLIGALGLILGAYDAAKIADQNNTLKKQVACNSQLVQFLEQDTAFRSRIAADDRRVVDDMVDTITKAIATGDRKLIPEAFERYKAERKINDKNRNTGAVSNLPASCVILLQDFVPDKPSPSTTK